MPPGRAPRGVTTMSEPDSGRGVGSASVLLVDDSPANLLALAAVLSPLHVRLVTAESGRDALRLVASEPFAVALIDVQMPEMDGFELTRRLRSLPYGRELPVLFVTAVHGEEEYVRRGYASGGADYITKPYDPEIIRARVRAFVHLFDQREAVRRGQIARRTRERDEAVRRLVALERIATAALESNDLQALLEELLHAFTGAADMADSATILLRSGDYLETAASVGFEEEVSARFRLRIGEGFAGTVAATRRPLELSNAADSNLISNEWIRERRVRGLYGLPLLHGGEVLGVAHIGSTRASVFSDAEKRLFAAAADRAALAVARHFEISSLNQVLTTAPAYIAIVRVPSREYVFVNPAFAELFGPDLIGKRLGDAPPGPQLEQTVERVLATGVAEQVDELALDVAPERRQEPLYVRFTAQPLNNPAGAVDRVLIFASDVTPQVLARREIEATQAMRLELLERERAARRAAELANTSKDDFLASVSHELRTPLNAILGWASLARSRAIPDVERALAIIERNALAQARIVEDVLDFSRIARGKMRLHMSSVALADTVREALETVRPAAEAKNISLEVDLGACPRLTADPQRLQQVVWNLLTNAIKFTPPGGRVTVTAESGDGMIALRVADTGQGIDPEFVAHVFEPFRQQSGGSRRTHGGLGLGLAIVQQIVQAHGGTVRAESAGIGRGATFVIRLPAECARTSQPPPTPIPMSTPDGAPVSHWSLDGLKVLVVDDDEDSRELLACALGQRGAKVASASGAHEALQELERFRPDVLVSDLAMPGQDGYELMQRVRALPPELGGAIPAVALTAHTRTGTREQAEAAGFQVLESKPVDLDRLAAHLAALGNKTLAAESA